ncbi:MAG: hypothetical protein U0795_24925 [Pirellulales bacterium]
MTSTAWTPPESPDPSAILRSAVDDMLDGQYDRSLTQFLWFHNHAVRYEPGLSAVRRSFALSYWCDLAAIYPPARDAFFRTRDETEQAFQSSTSDFELFHDVAAMNDYLNDGVRTADLFASAAGTNQENAQQLYQVAERYLIAAGRFTECGPYLDPKRRTELAARSFRIVQQFEESSPSLGCPAPKLPRTDYLHDMATLVGLLVLNGRVDEARMAYDDALEIVHDDEYRKILDAAMSGHLPEARL